MEVIASDKKSNLLNILDDKEICIEFNSVISSIPKRLRKLCVKKTAKTVTLKI